MEISADRSRSEIVTKFFFCLTENLEAMMEQLSGTGSAEDQAMMKEMFANLKGQQDALKQQTEALEKMKSEQLEKMASMEGQLAQRHE